MPRLSEVLSKAPGDEDKQVDGFFVGQRIRHGMHKMINVGDIIRDARCRTCDSDRPFMSSGKLSCLVVGERVVSIDAFLKCAVCAETIETWFLVVSRDDLHGQAPHVRLERYVENRRDMAGVTGLGGDFDELLERARFAYEAGLGAGAMVYLRKIFEAITMQAATVAGIPTEENGRRKTFRRLLREVDAVRHIIPSTFASNSYALFSELSDVVHGDSNEEVALEKYRPCERLVRGIIQNVANDQEMRQAIDELGWGAGGVDGQAQEGIAS